MKESFCVEAKIINGLGSKLSKSISNLYFKIFSELFSSFKLKLIKNSHRVFYDRRPVTFAYCRLGLEVAVPPEVSHHLFLVQLPKQPADVSPPFRDGAPLCWHLYKRLSGFLHLGDIL